MSKIIPLFLAVGCLGMLGGCATKPQPEPVQSSQQEQIAEAIAQAEAERLAALEVAEEARRSHQETEKALSRATEENRRLRKAFRSGLRK